MADESDAATFGMTKDAYALRTHEDMANFYDKYAAEYDQNLIGGDVNFMGAALAAKYFAEQGLPKDCRILDVAAGTGLVGSYLQKQHKYTNIDAHDGLQVMLDVAKQKNVYKNTICCFLGDGHTFPLDNNVYDGIVISGAFAPGHMKCDSFLEMIRVVKPGGIIVNVMREENVRKVEENTKLHPLFSKWEEEGKWSKVAHVIPEEKFYTHYDALVHIYRVN